MFFRELTTGAALKRIDVAAISVPQSCSVNARLATSRRWFIWSRPRFVSILRSQLWQERSRRTSRFIALILTTIGAAECASCAANELTPEVADQVVSRR